MYKFTEAEMTALLSFNVFQYLEGVRTKEALLEVCRMYRDELEVDSLLGFIRIIRLTLQGTYRKEVEDMLFNYDDADSYSYQLIASLYRQSLSESDTLQAVADALMLEALKLHDGDKESFCDMLYILTDKIEQIGELQT